MKSERPDLPLTIARLVRSAQPVRPLASPSVRLTRWAVTSTALAVLSVVVLGVRPDIAAQVGNGWFLARAAATLAIVASAAVVALSMSVPGFEPSRWLQALPASACVVWTAMLVGVIAAARAPLGLLMQATPHPSCVLLIVATAILPGAILVRMLRDAAPLPARWTGGFAGLATLAVGALATQFVCTNDAAAHHLLWHVTPVVLLTLASAAAGPTLTGWSRQQA